MAPVSILDCPSRTSSVPYLAGLLRAWWTVKYKFKTKPYLYQVKGVRFAFRQFSQGLGVGFLFEPRTGKTKTTIDTLAILHHKVGLRKALIIAPNRVLGVWVKEFHKHCDLNVQIVVWDANARKGTLPSTVEPYDMQVVIVNWEAFGKPGTKLPSGKRSKANGRYKNRSKILKWIGYNYPHGPVACVVDEAHKLKSPSGKASTMVVGMREYFLYRFALTGTPITKANRAHDCYMLWQWINPDRFSDWGSTVAEFKNHVGRWISSNGYPQWVGHKERGMADLKRGIHKDALVIKRRYQHELPPQHRIIEVPLSTSARHYDEMAEHMFTRLQNGEIAEAKIPVEVYLRLAQITSGFVGRRIPHPDPKKAEDGVLATVLHRVGTEKIKALKELFVEEILERGEKVVIAGRFKPDLNISERLAKHFKLPVWSIRGGMTRSESDGALRAFEKYTKGPAVMVVQPQAASLGIDLSTSNHLVWFSLTSSFVDWTQTNDRIALAEDRPMYTYFCCPGTVDMLMYEALQNDQSVAQEIMKHPERILRR
jgi:SNF2 family DNA or RNA helicase